MGRIFMVLILCVLAVGCEQKIEPQLVTGCDRDNWVRLIGGPPEPIDPAVSRERKVFYVYPNQPVSSDHNPTRTRIYVNKNNIVTQVACG